MSASAVEHASGVPAAAVTAGTASSPPSRPAAARSAALFGRGFLDLWEFTSERPFCGVKRYVKLSRPRGYGGVGKH
jgi:hypothetical protein